MTSSLTIGLISAGCIFGGVLLGLVLRGLLPDYHLRDDSKDTVKVGAGMIATVSALVLGLLVASAKNTFDMTEAEITQRSAKIILLDRVLADYGPETKATREQLRNTVAATIEMLWPAEKKELSGLTGYEQANGMEFVQITLLVVLLFWLTMLHISFGLLAPRNATVITVLLISALSVSGALFIILDMTHPLQGMIKVSSTPMRNALEHLGK